MDQMAKTIAAALSVLNPRRVNLGPAKRDAIAASAHPCACDNCDKCHDNRDNFAPPAT